MKKFLDNSQQSTHKKRKALPANVELTFDGDEEFCCRPSLLKKVRTRHLTLLLQGPGVCYNTSLKNFPIYSHMSVHEHQKYCYSLCFFDFHLNVFLSFCKVFFSFS